MTVIISKITDGMKTNYEQQSYHQMLKIGETWEDVVCLYFQELGIKCERYKQDMTMLSPYSVKFSQFQRDLFLIHPKTGKKFNIEVKSRNSPWKYPSILVGKCSTWDAKKYKVKYLIVVDQNTGESLITKADEMTRNAEWGRNKNVKTGEISYTVQRRFFAPLEAFTDFVKV